MYWRVSRKQRQTSCHPGAAMRRNLRKPDIFRRRCQPGSYKPVTAAGWARVDGDRHDLFQHPRRMNGATAARLVKVLRKWPISSGKACTLQHRGILGENNRAYALKSLVSRGRMPDLGVGLYKS